MIGTRVALYLLVFLVWAGIETGTSVAQESHAQSSASSSSAAKAASPSDRVVLKVGDVRVTQAEFEASVEGIEPETEPEKGGDLEKDRRKLGDDYASVLMLSRLAVANHLDKTEEIRRQLDIARLQILSDAEFASLMSQAKPKLQEISDYYSSHLPEFDRLRLRRLFIWKVSGESKNTHGLSPEVARARANAILQASGADADKLAEAFRGSKEGLLDQDTIQFTHRDMPPRMEKAFGFKEGQWSEVEDTPDAILLAQVTKHDRLSLLEVSSLIEKRLQGLKMQAQLDELKKKAGIWMDEEYFGPAVAGIPASQPPSKLGKSAVKKQESTNEDAPRK